MADYRMEEMVKEALQSCLGFTHNVTNNNGEDYFLTTTVTWRGQYITSAHTTIPKDLGLKLAEKL